MERLHELPWQDDVLDIECCGEEWRYFLVSESGDAAADACHEECQLGMAGGELNELVHVWLDGLHSALHGGNGITLALQTDALAPDGAKALARDMGGTSAMSTCQVAAKHENFTRIQCRNSIRGICSIVHAVRMFDVVNNMMLPHGDMRMQI